MTSLDRQAELPPKNESFMSKDNLIWFHFVLNYQPPLDKPLVFLPCGSANKTRKQDGRKYISKGLSHEFMSVITRNSKYCKIILSEPLSLIPYDLEDHPLRKDYNLPPEYLAIHSELIFIHNVALYLARLKNKQPTRNVIFYLGATHHYFILFFANQLAGSPFQIIHYIPPRGLTDYALGAKIMVEMIEKTQKGIHLDLTQPCLEDHLKKRGRYTNLRFWHQILVLQKEITSYEIISPNDAFQIGFQILYQTQFANHSLDSIMGGL